MNQYPPPMYPPPPPRKSGRGWVIALSILGGLSVICVVAVVIGVYAFSKSETGKATFKAMEVVKQSANAPGTKELRDIGCDESMVLDTEEFTNSFSALLDAEAPSDEEDAKLVVMCQASGAAPSCDDVASTYLRAVGSVPRNFIAVVKKRSDKSVCQGVYDRSGKFVAEVEE